MERTNEQLKRILDSNFDSTVQRQVAIENGEAEPENKREQMLLNAAYLFAKGELDEEDMEATRSFLYRDANASEATAVEAETAIEQTPSGFTPEEIQTIRDFIGPSRSITGLLREVLPQPLGLPE